LPGGKGRPGAQNNSSSPGLKPGAPKGQGQGKDNLVICEICDGYIRDLEQLRNHMQWIHKVKIHPKMIYNRPPLNCQKCQFRFFTDQVNIYISRHWKDHFKNDRRSDGFRRLKIGSALECLYIRHHPKFLQADSKLAVDLAFFHGKGDVQHWGFGSHFF
jgi:hypothetical protein